MLKHRTRFGCCLFPRLAAPDSRRIFIACASIAFSTQAGFAQLAAPPVVTVAAPAAPLGNGFMFIGPQNVVGSADPIQGPEIIDNLGRPVWFLPTPGNMATDFRVQSYQGSPVLTWSQGITSGDPRPGNTTDYIMDNTYTVIATVQAGNGYNADIHEFQLTPENTALITIYNSVPGDLSSVGGPQNGTILEGVVQEIDVATGRVLFEWHSLTDVPVADTYLPYDSSGVFGFDYFHINSVKLDVDGNLLISSRHTWTVYKVNRATGALMWRLGGKRSDFSLGRGLPFAWQHDVEAVDAQTLRIFDNESDGVSVLPSSRVIWVKHDDSTMTASVNRFIEQPSQRSVAAEGSAQTLDNGDTFVEWGIIGAISEFDPAGNLVFSASEAPGYASYRGYRFPWVGSPAAPPAITASLGDNGMISVHAIWNGATEVATWEVMGGPDGNALAPVASAPWNGIDTVVQVKGPLGSLRVDALDSNGNILGSSQVVAGPNAEFLAQPESPSVAAGATVALNAVATYPGATTYQWYFNGTALSDGAFAGADVAGANDPVLVVSGATAGNAGAYSCVATSYGFSVTSNTASLSVSDSGTGGQLENISCRANVGPANASLILGFTVGSNGASGVDSLLVRASGPALAPLGVIGFLPDPSLQILDNGVSIASNEGWGGDPQIQMTAAAVGAFAWSDASSADAAIETGFNNGSYSAVISSAGGDSGVALGEVYEANPAPSGGAPAHLTNLSGRALAGSGQSALIAGFVIGGTQAATVLLRASGPALQAFGVQNPLGDPLLSLYRTNSDGSTTLVGSNSGWNADPQIASAAAAVGAFSWGQTATPDAAMVLTLPPGIYSATIEGASGDSGMSLVELYELP